MKIKVTRGYISHERELYGVGSIFDLDDGEAKRLIEKGVAEAAPATKTAKATPQPEKTKKETAKAEVEAGGAELPAVDPLASVQKGRKK